MPPTFEASTFTCTSSVESLSSASRSASALPCTSVLISTGMTLILASSICENTSSARGRHAAGDARVAVPALAMQRHFARLAVALHHQQIVAGIGRARAGPAPPPAWTAAASFTGLPVSSNMARTRPNCVAGEDRVAELQRAALDQHGGHGAAALLDAGFDHDARGQAVARRRQFQHFGLQQDGLEQLVDALAGLRGHVARTCRCRPTPRRRRRASTVPCARAPGRRRACRSCSPPPRWARRQRGHAATASMVCGITPSSAATTSTTTSVALAPRARMAVNAAWPGVSRKVTMPRGVSTW